MPLAASSVPHELTTPTGAAIVAALANSFGPPPAMKIDVIGYGAGQRDLEQQPNLLRILVGEPATNLELEQLWLVETNLDDISGELVGHTIQKLWQAGALDVYTTSIQMKKNRPGIALSALCNAADCETLAGILFRETTALGIRRYSVWRERLRREPHEVETPWGPVGGMLAWIGNEPPQFSPEFESCRSVADKNGVPLKKVYEAAHRAFHPPSSNIA